MSLGRRFVPRLGGLAFAVFCSTLGACAHGIEPSAEGPSLITSDDGKDAGRGAVSSGSGGQAGSSIPPSSSGGSAGDAPGGGETAGTGGTSGIGGGGGADDDAGDAATGNTGGGGAGGAPVVEAGPPAAPTAVSIGTQTTPSEVRAPGVGGTTYSDLCPANQVLIGFKGTVDAAGGQTYLRSVQGICGTLTVTGSGTYAVAVTQAGQLPVRQSASAVAQSVNCGANQVIVGFGGRSGGFIDALRFRCAPLTIGGASPNYTLALGSIVTTGIIGGATGGSDFADIDCASGMVAVGQAPHAGAAIDAFGLVCATPSLTIK
jgi:hypothetical protein